MASGTINITGNLVSGTITKSSNINESASLDMATCNRVNNIVMVSGRLQNISNVFANTTFFKIPENFRPQSLLYSIGFATIGGNTITWPVRIQPNGDVELVYGSVYCTYIYFCATYSI